MKVLQTMVFASLLLGSLSARAELPVINIGVSGEISPGVYGEVHFGNAPPPPVVYAQPTIIERLPPNAEVRPLYLHVPPGHARDWARHCREYNACNRPVYFVRSAEYEPGYRGHGDHGRRDEGRGDEGRRGEGYRDEGRRGDDYRDREEGRGDEGRRGRD